MKIVYYLIFNFIIYSFLGWIIEQLYCLLVNKKFKKDGFLMGPVKPMYGISMVTLVFCYYIINIQGLGIVLLCLIVPSIVEYISGYLLKSIFGKVYWSYEEIRFNISGYICLRFSLYWMILSLIGILFLQPEINRIFIELYNIYFKGILILLIFMYIIDFIITLKYYCSKTCIKLKN